MHRLELKIPPPLIGLCTAALMWLAARAVSALAFELPSRIEIAIALVAAGLLVDVAGILSFIRARTTVNPLKPASASALVTSGIYNFTRNPMYLGMLLILLGWAVYLANIVAFIVVPLYVLYLNRFQIRPEERVLATVFGQDYADYTSRVRRWL